MQFKVASKLQYSVKDLSAFMLNVSVAKTPAQTVITEKLTIEPFIAVEEILSPDNINRSIRFEAVADINLIVEYSATVHQAYQLIAKENLHQISIAHLPASTITYLFPSRYCQSDRLMRLASDKFGEIENGYDKVMAICEWIYQNVDYVSGTTNSETSAFDTVTQREGVCRDFAHLGIALCRALNIPARYFSGYAYQLNPPDFHACFEAYLGGYWILFDATRLAPLNGLIRIGIGRDATDISVASIYGNVEFVSMEASSEVQEGSFEPLYPGDLKEKGLCL